VATLRPIRTVNLGGEGEEPDVLNQQPPFALAVTWGCSRTGETFEQLATRGIDFLICANTGLAINDGSMDLVITNSVPIDGMHFGIPGIQTSEVHRILAPGGVWLHDGSVRFTKP
jgi:hypothetical protein